MPGASLTLTSDIRTSQTTAMLMIMAASLCNCVEHYWSNGTVSSESANEIVGDTLASEGRNSAFCALTCRSAQILRNTPQGACAIDIRSRPENLAVAAYFLCGGELSCET